MLRDSVGSEGDVPMTEMTRSDELSWAAVSLKPCSVNFRPPAKKHMPNTRRRLERIEPRRDDWTTCSSRQRAGQRLANARGTSRDLYAPVSRNAQER